MKREELDQLLERFYEGSLSVQEEDSLKQAVQWGDWPADLQRDRHLLQALWAEQDEPEDEITLPEGLEDRLVKRIDVEAEREEETVKRDAFRHRLRWISSVAAALLLLFVMGYGWDSFSGKTLQPTPQDTFTNPEDAYRVLEAVLRDASGQMHQGLCQLQDSREAVAETRMEVEQEIFNKP